MQVQRVYVEKKPGFDVEARSLAGDIRGVLGIGGLKSVRILCRYDVQGLSQADFAQAKETIFSEPAVDVVYDALPTFAGRVFARAYLPGQYDQRADSAAQCVQFLTQGARPTVRCATVYLLEGDITDDQFAAIKRDVINPVESCEVGQDLPETLDIALPEPADVPSVPLCAMDDAAVAALREEMGLAMSLEDACFVRDYFKTQRRDPSLTEIRVIDTYWSDHCRHTTFATALDEVAIDDSPFLYKVGEAWQTYQQARKTLYGDREASRTVCLMDLATIGAKLLQKRGLLEDLDASEEINACSIRAEIDVDGRPEPYLIMFKNETHNHPTEIEPFGGAATCLGGAIRDPLSGRAYVYQAMRVTGAADPRASVKDTMPGKLPQRHITRGAAAGYSSYGNQIGLATGQVVEIYHPGYAAKRMEIGAVIGAAPADHVVRQAPKPGDIVVLLGGRTGRDGCGGATGSSKAHDASSIDTCGAEVQKGNPPTERKLQRLFRRREAARMIKRCNDFGAGGVCVAVGELAPGLDIDLDAVPRKYEGLDGTELAISESQERMAVVLDAKDVDAFIALCGEENLEAVRVAVVTDTGRMRMTWRGRELVNIERSFLDTNGVTQHAHARVVAPAKESYFAPRPVADAKAQLLELLSSLNGGSQRGLAERFDATIGAGTVLMPFAGKYQATPTQAMAAKVPLERGETHTGTLMTFGFDADLASWSPFHGAAYAVVESLNRIACAGGDISKARLTLQEYFERMRTAPERWGKPLAALLGALYAQDKLGVAAIGGKDSMSGSFEDLDVPPTLVCFAVAVADMRRVISAELKEEGSTLALVTLPRGADEMPDFAQFSVNCAALRDAIDRGDVLAAHTVGYGGAALACARMAFGNRLGVTLTLEKDALFAPNIGSAVVELRRGVDARGCFPQSDVRVIGRVTQDASIVLDRQSLPLQEALAAFEGMMEKVFPIRKGEAPQQIKTETCALRNTRKPAVRVARPRVLIPVFPGTNCEYDSARAFEAAGALCDTMVVRNLTQADIAWTVEELARRIANAQIIMLPGGFSAGDEPEGSGKFIATALRAPRIRDAVHALLGERDGLMLGICNGFQALIKLGLVPYGDIRPMRSDSPTLTFNSIGRHQSRIVRTRVVSTLSPWMQGVQAGDIISVPISHGEGRFVITQEEYDRLLTNGQIATQYVDDQGEPTWNIDYNPNGAMHAVEGITSPDGRILGKMGHSERAQAGTFKNVPGNYASGIFAAGVRYFL
nr:phosphoribosylformylglycinamidine synthase [Maliibacterium massiliense]